jgi:hypothetical protein
MQGWTISNYLFALGGVLGALAMWATQVSDRQAQHRNHGSIRSRSSRARAGHARDFGWRPNSEPFVLIRILDCPNFGLGPF